jgi:hypothetical protein
MVVVLLSLAAPPAPAWSSPDAVARWDANGHRIIATIAYERLRPDTRQRVDSLLRYHPDYAAFSRGLPAGAPGLALEVFQRASVWPDNLRGDARFYNEATNTPVPTPPLPGFPDMQRHAGWHYINEPFSTDGTATVETATPNAFTAIVALTRDLGDPTLPMATRAYDLSWLLHLVGDIHQPLHSVARFSRALPAGDAGGNRLQVQSGATPQDTTNMHSFWDGVVTRGNRGVSDVELARRITAEVRPVDNSETRVEYGPLFEGTVQDWVKESATLARYVVYSLPDRAEGGPPVRATPEYHVLAEDVARQRMAMAGYRLANLIEARLGQ